MSDFAPTERTRVRRLAKRAVYDRDVVYRILDEGLVCHVGLVVEGRPVVLPTLYGRHEDTLYLHGSAASRMLRNLAQGVEACVTVTLLDGLVLARSAFHHSVNYRSVVIYGTASVVEDPQAKCEALRLFMEHVIPERWSEARPPNEKELAVTAVLSMPLEEVSAKVRTGPAMDDEEDYLLPVWAGVLPLELTAGAPIPDQRLKEGTPVPDYLRRYKRSR